MKKKVLFMIDSLTCGGAEKSLVSLLPLLDKEKYDVYLWVRSRGGSFEALLDKNVRLVETPYYSSIEKFAFLIGRVLYSIVFRIKDLLGIKEHGAETLWKCQGWAMKVPEGKWDVVIAYQQGIPTYLAAKKYKGCKKIAWINADIFKAGYNVDFNSEIYKDIDWIVPVSSVLSDLLMLHMPQFKDKYKLVYDILNPNTIKELAMSDAQSFKTRRDEIVLVTVGRLVPPKGYDLAVDAAFELKKMGLNYKWYFVGEGGERSNIERQINELGVKDEVCLLGLQTNPYPFMRQADIYVQTSKFEGFGLTIGEAKILGKPIVSTNFDVVYNQIEDGKNGLLAEMNGKSIANAIFKLVTNISLKDRIVAAVQMEGNCTYLSEAKKVETLLDA